MVNDGKTGAPPGRPEALGGEDSADIPDLTGQVKIEEHRGAAAHPVHSDGDIHRRLFETELHTISADLRESMAIQAVEPQLSALCFDPVSRVIRRLLDNPRFGLTHARLIAAHHMNGSGLEALGIRGVLVNDREVQRLLLRNTQTPLHLLHRILSRHRCLDIWSVVQSHDVSDRNKSTARDCLRQRFATCTSEEKVDLIMHSEGRALIALSGVPLDAKAVSLLCKQSFTSTVLIRNLAQWGPAPPPVLIHLMRQTVVRQNPQLRAIVRRHPNCPPVQ